MNFVAGSTMNGRNSSCYLTTVNIENKKHSETKVFVDNKDCLYTDIAQLITINKHGEAATHLRQ